MSLAAILFLHVQILKAQPLNCYTTTPFVTEQRETSRRNNSKNTTLNSASIRKALI